MLESDRVQPDRLFCARRRNPCCYAGSPRGLTQSRCERVSDVRGRPIPLIPSYFHYFSTIKEKLVIKFLWHADPRR